MPIPIPISVTGYGDISTLLQLHPLVRSQPASSPLEPPGTTEAVGPPSTRPARLIRRAKAYCTGAIWRPAWPSCRAEADRAGPVMVRTIWICLGLAWKWVTHSLTHLLTHSLTFTHFHIHLW